MNLEIKSIIKFILLAIVLNTSLLIYQLKACTSFVIYGESGQIYYGMNFDYPDVEMRFSIMQNNSINIFHLEFYENGNWYSTVGMNTSGFFSSCQMLYPEVNSFSYPSDNEISIGYLYYVSLFNIDTVNTIINNFDTSETKIIHTYGKTLHNIFADKYGNAITLEVGTNEPLITQIQDSFLVMTNFPNSEYCGQPYTEVQGVGAERYKAAFEYILNHFNGFDFNDGIETLKQSIQSSGSYRTQCSFLFDPLKLEIYIVIKRDFDKIWKVDLIEETIETFTGFDFSVKLDMDNGILTSELIELIDSHAESINTYQSKTLEYLIYPNPAINSIKISSSDLLLKPVKYQLFDFYGRVIKQGDLKSDCLINISDINKGSYMLNIISDNKNTCQKIIIE